MLTVRGFPETVCGHTAIRIGMVRIMTHEKTLTDLANALQNLSDSSFSQDDAHQAARNLQGFFELLLTIDQENTVPRQ